jgi:hypothetical protein
MAIAIIGIRMENEHRTRQATRTIRQFLERSS